jgi:hypothetical protein
MKREIGKKKRDKENRTYEIKVIEPYIINIVHLTVTGRDDD